MHSLHSHSFSRPRVPDDRPHTVHATCGSHEMHDTGSFGFESDDQVTPRASLAGLSILAEAAERRLSRDDTAADVSELVYGRFNDNASSRTGKQQAFGGWLDSTPFEPFQFRGDTQSINTYPSASSNLQYRTNEPQDTSASQAKQARSLGRRFSRSYKEKVSELRDSMTKVAPRMRRASTPHHNPNAPIPPEQQDRFGQVQPSLCKLAPPPHSPSKRSQRYPDPRLKKFRSAFGVGERRRDTPQPTNVLSMPKHPLVLPSRSYHDLSGGSAAREAARTATAHYKPRSLDPAFVHEFFQAGDDVLEQEDLRERRGRLGSNSTAADSGADLPSFGYPSPKDSAGESDDELMPDVDEMGNVLSAELPRRIDFVTEELLPSELKLSIFELLDGEDLARVRLVSRSWRATCNKKSVWRTAYLRKYGRQVFTNPAPIQIGGLGAGRPEKAQPHQKWDKMYKARKALEKNWRAGPEQAGKAIYLSGHTDSVYCLQFDEEKIITGSRDRTIRVWDINTFQCIKVIGGPNVRPVLGPKLLRTVDYPAFHLATASVNGTAYGNGIYHEPKEWHDASILCLQYDDKILVTGSSDSHLLVWDIETYEPIKRLIRHTGGVLDVALDAKHIVSCSKDWRIIVWDRATYEPVGELTGHRGPVNAIQLRGKLLVSASGDGIARLWNIKELKLVKEFAAKERGLAAVEFSEDMKYVLAGGNDHITYKFDVETGAEVMKYEGHTQLVRSLWLDSANERIVSGSYDLDLRVYDFNTGELIWRAEEWTTSWMLAAKSDYRRIVATSQDGRILVVDFGLKKGGQEDGQPIDNIDLLHGLDDTTAVKFRNPWIEKVEESDDEID